MSGLTDDRRRWLRERAAKTVATAIAHTKICWGGGWFSITDDMRRGDIARRVMGSIGDHEMPEADLGVYCLALADEVLRAKL